MHYFDLQHTLLAKHAQHIVLVHFPIALMVIAWVFDLLELRLRDGKWQRAAYYNLTIAAAATIPVIITGLFAWRWHLEGAPLRGVLRLHLALGVTSSVLIVSTWWNARRGSSRVTRVVLEAITVLVVTATAHLGGVVAGLVS